MPLSPTEPVGAAVHLRACAAKAEAQVVVAVGRIVVVAIGCAYVRRIIVPTAAPKNPVRA